MRPGAWSHGGFLGSDESLADVLLADARAVERLGVTVGDIAGVLERLIVAADEAPRRHARVAGHFDVRISVVKGFQMCPWTEDPHGGQCRAGGGVRYASLDWRIRNLRADRAMQGPGLAVHLIRDHAFFEGPQSPYRLDPGELALLLDLI
jgi:hypothetical protein